MIRKDLVCVVLKVNSLNALIISLKSFEEINASLMNYIMLKNKL